MRFRCCQLEGSGSAKPEEVDVWHSGHAERNCRAQGCLSFSGKNIRIPGSEDTMVDVRNASTKLMRMSVATVTRRHGRSRCEMPCNNTTTARCHHGAICWNRFSIPSYQHRCTLINSARAIFVLLRVVCFPPGSASLFLSASHDQSAGIMGKLCRVKPATYSSCFMCLRGNDITRSMLQIVRTISMDER